MDAELDAVTLAIARLWEKGCPAAGRPAESARIAIRRWHSVARRERKVTRDARIRDLTAGLIQAFEEDPRLVGPLKRDYECVAEAVANVLDPSDPTRDIERH